MEGSEGPTRGLLGNWPFRPASGNNGYGEKAKNV